MGRRRKSKIFKKLKKQLEERYVPKDNTQVRDLEKDYEEFRRGRGRRGED